MENEETPRDFDVRVTRSDDLDVAEQRAYALLRTSQEGRCTVVWWFNCPWCDRRIKAYLWGLSGMGKRCNCGAIFYSHFFGYKRFLKTGEKS